MKKGFTLIELLGVITLLGVIILIVFPIVLKQINTAKKEINNANDAIIIEAAKDYMADNINDYKKIEGNTYCINLDTLLNSQYLNMNLKNTDLTDIDNARIVKATYTNNFNYEIVDECTAFQSDQEQGDEPTKYKNNIKFPTGDENETYIAEVYLDPKDLNKACTEEEAKPNSKTGTKEGCMKWYVYKDSDSSNPSSGTYTMILDHNTTATVEWASKKDYGDSSKAGNVGITYSSGTPSGSYGTNGNNNKGPLTVLAQLKNDTDSWSTELGTSETYQPSTGDFQWTIDYSGYKARLITAEEVADITKEDRSKGSNASSGPEANWTLGSDDFILDRRTGDCFWNGSCDTDGVISKYWWLFNNLGNGNNYSCKTYGCKEGEISDPCGYWTSSPGEIDIAYSWRVFYYGNMGFDGVFINTMYGVRPVITVSKSKFIQE